MKALFASRGPHLIGVIHLLPLPGSPRWGGRLEPVLQAARRDAEAYAKGGADAVIIENFGDIPFTKGAVAPETIATMAVVASSVREGCTLPIGFNVLRNDGHSALALCAACQGTFIRINVLSGAMLTDQGVIEGDAYRIARLRRQLAPHVKILADVQVKHAVPFGNLPIEAAARDTLERGLADALIVSGSGTGEAVDLADLRRTRAACADAIVLIGSGASAANIASCLESADGAIVGTSVKVGGKVTNRVDPLRVKELRRAMNASSLPTRKPSAQKRSL